MQLSLLNHKKFTPRNYQLQVKSDTYKLCNQGIKKICIVAPTGAGKTVIATLFAIDAVSKNRRIVFLVHRDVLADQTAKTFQSFGLDCGFIMGSKAENPEAKIQIASVQTLSVRKDIELNFDIYFYDECHLTAWSNIGKQLLSKDAWHFGLTATPWRLKKTEGMGDLFEGLVTAPLPYQLIEMGYLVKPRYFTLPEVDLSGVKTTAGDYNLGDLGTVCNKSEVIESLVENWLEIANGKRTIIFAVNVSHAKAIADHFQQKGINAKAVYGAMSLKSREIIYQELRDNQTQIVVSCEALAEGFDVPSIECVCLARPTKSQAKYFQQVGRGLRIAEGKKECLVLDQAGLISQFGIIEDLTSIELTNGKKKGQCTNFCQSCGCGILPGMTFCPRCAESTLKIKNYPVGKMKELIIASGLKRKFDWYQARVKLAYHRGYSPGWAIIQYQDHYKELPDRKWSYHAVWEDPSDHNKEQYFFYLNNLAILKNKSTQWIKYWYKVQFDEECPFKIKGFLVQENIEDLFKKELVN